MREDERRRKEGEKQVQILTLEKPTNDQVLAPRERALSPPNANARHSLSRLLSIEIRTDTIHYEHVLLVHHKIIDNSIHTREGSMSRGFETVDM